jgi:hypothetical protein
MGAFDGDDPASENWVGLNDYPLEELPRFD